MNIKRLKIKRLKNYEYSYGLAFYTVGDKTCIIDFIANIFINLLPNYDAIFSFLKFNSPKRTYKAR